MHSNTELTTILIAEDDDDDRMMIEDAFRECGLRNPLRFVVDGEELMDYLYQRRQFVDGVGFPRPGLILLDLNMPRKDGREALLEIKTDRALCQTPVVVLTTSRSPDDVSRCYQNGANSFISKPGGYVALLELVHTLSQYWLQTARLPPAEH